MSEHLVNPELLPLGLRGAPTDRRAALPHRQLVRAAGDAVLDQDDSPRSTLLDLRAPLKIERAWMAEIAVPGGFVSGEAAWYGMGVWRVGDHVPDEVALTGYAIEANAADVDGGGGYSAWGDVRGEAAAVVIARDIGIGLGEWRSAPSYMPGVEAAGATSLLTQRPAPEWVRAWGLPPGKYTDTSPAKLYDARVFGADQYPLSSGHTIGVYLVVRGSQIQAAAGGTIRGRIHVELSLSRTTDPRSWRT